MVETTRYGRTPRIGEVYNILFDGDGSRQNGWRPGVIFQNNVGNIYSPNVIALPMTSSLKRLDLPVHVLVRSCDTGLRRDSVVLCENPETVPKCRIGAYITTLSDEYMRKVAIAHLAALSSLSFLSKGDVESAMMYAKNINGVA